MKIAEIIAALENLAHPSLQEHYDNAGLITGSADWKCTGIICSLDATEEVVLEAIKKKCNLVVAHHPIVFNGLKKINGKNYVEKTIIAAIKHDIAIYAIHTNLDNVLNGVNGTIAAKLGLKKVVLLAEKDDTLQKLVTFAPVAYAGKVRDAVFAAGGGNIGNYSECSFNTRGTGTFYAGEASNPVIGRKGERHEEEEVKIEVIFPAYLQGKLVAAMKAAHLYEEVAYDIIPLVNKYQGFGAGVVGELTTAMEEKKFITRLKKVFGVPVVRHSALTGKPVKKVAICGGAGSFLISKALAAEADAYITADMKYHEFFDANGKLLIADVGHYESEQFTISLLQEYLEQKFPTFAVLKTGVITNPVHYS
ncbi:MAG TPA: Nif3-like dinuclear metal center hexameric protein [Chitinophagaceae bacterium]|nr:Nif3-like dinuclear metal center hexameric protein [Chitinophagaceae bacterium]